MTRRLGFLSMLTLAVGLSGCASTANRPDGMPIAGRQAWSEPPAPPQRSAAVADESTSTAMPSPAKAEGLARYFPGFARKPVEAPKLAARHRPSWFGLRPKSAPTQVYTTDARAGLNPKLGPEPTTLPVALQVPSGPPSADRSVTPARAEAAAAAPPSARFSDLGVDRSPDGTTSAASFVPDFGGKPSKPGEDEVNPLPPATEPAASPPAADTSPAVVDRMPQVPSVDPTAPAKPVDPRPSTAGTRPPVEPGGLPGMGKESATATRPGTPSEASDSSEPTITAAYVAKSSPPTAPSSTKTLSTSRVGTPRPSSQVLASPPASPTSQARPSPQVTASPQSDVCSECGAHLKKRPCLRRLVRKVCKLGEYDSPPTAAPH